MITIIGIGRKIIASLISSVILSLFLTFTAYDYPEVSNFIPIFTFSAGYTLIIGVPCSIVTDLVINKMKRTIIYYVTGLILHLIFAGVVAYLFITADDTLKYGFFCIRGFSGSSRFMACGQCLKKFEEII